MAGKLSIVATPIGNLEDITLRAIRLLREASLIACEDTRHTRKLLEHLGIATRTVSYHEHNEEDRAQELVTAVERGEQVALVSDAGTPLLSDPGFRVVRAAIDAGLTLEIAPGPSALLAAVAGCGIGCSTFYFGGFLPSKRTQRTAVLEQVKDIDSALIFYEAPHRIVESLDEIGAILPNRNVCAARELTKLHEEWLRGSSGDIAAELRSRTAVKGEFVLVLGKASAKIDDPTESLEEAVERHVASGKDRMDALKEAARARGLSKREVYKLVEIAKKNRKPE